MSVIIDLYAIKLYNLLKDEFVHTVLVKGPTELNKSIKGITITIRTTFFEY